MTEIEAAYRPATVEDFTPGLNYVKLKQENSEGEVGFNVKPQTISNSITTESIAFMEGIADGTIWIELPPEA